MEMVAFLLMVFIASIAAHFEKKIKLSRHRLAVESNSDLLAESENSETKNSNIKVYSSEVLGFFLGCLTVLNILLCLPVICIAGCVNFKGNVILSPLAVFCSIIGLFACIQFMWSSYERKQYIWSTILGIIPGAICAICFDMLARGLFQKSLIELRLFS